MLISNLFISCGLLLVPSAICSGLQQDGSSGNEKSSKQLQTETDEYEYHHPPLPEVKERQKSRQEKSINLDKQTPSPDKNTRSRASRRRVRPNPSTQGLEIPVQVIYETEATTVRSYSSTSKSTISPIDRTTRAFARRRQPDANKKIDIRQTTVKTNDIDNVNVTDKARVNTDKEKSDISSATEFPKRSRESYFKKRIESPAPRVKILEEKNFVYAHSGNFHYSFLGGDGTKVSSEGSLKSYDNNKTGEAVSGTVFYKDNDGNDYSLSYTADENGYRPTGAHLPTPPPVPPAIARALKYIADKSTPSPTTKSE